MTDKSVPGYGPLTAKLCVIGEAPGTQEVIQRRPFVGPSGNLLRRWMRSTNIDPGTVYFDNVYPYYPQKRVASSPPGFIGNVPAAELDYYKKADLPDRLKQLRNVSIIVPTGNIALEAITGEKSITKWRGSLLKPKSELGFTSDVFVIPTIHPAAILRGGGAQRHLDAGFKSTINWEKRCRADWSKIASLLYDSEEISIPIRQHIIDPTPEEIGNLFTNLTDAKNENWYKPKPHHKAHMSIDIETSVDTILCVGFSLTPNQSYTIPYAAKGWRREAIRLLCESWIPKVLHNGHYDAYWLAQDGIEVNNWYDDTLLMHHAIDPIEEHSLHFLASIYTNEPYWKDEGKYEWKPGNLKRDWNQLMRYCGKDACVTLELYYTLYEILLAQGKDTYYKDIYGDMIDPILATMLHGVRIDDHSRRHKYVELRQRSKELRDELARFNDGQPLFKLTTKRDRAVWEARQAGKDVWTEPIQKTKNKNYTHAEIKKSLETIDAKNVSNQELQSLLYGKLGLPKQLKNRPDRSKTVTVDEVALRTLRLQFAQRRPEVGEIIDIALENARATKLSSFLAEGKADADSRIRCSYKLAGTETSRLSSAKNPKRTGYNLQNVDREARSIFVPDEGCIFLEVDLSQAESRVVGALSRDRTLIEIARTFPWEFDVHTYNAARVFGIAESEVTKEQRYLGKRAVHASNYGMQGKKLSEILLTDGYVYTVRECQAMIDRYLARFPAILDWQKRTRSTVIHQRKLTNSWGTEFYVPYERLVDDLYRRAYAFIPQSEVGILLNQYGFKPLHRASIGTKIQINLQVHDALVISVPPKYVWNVAKFLKDRLERTRKYDQVSISIPIEYALGTCWSKEGAAKGMHEFKQLPDKQQMIDLAHSLLEKHE